MKSFGLTSVHEPKTEKKKFKCSIKMFISKTARANDIFISKHSENSQEMEIHF